MSSVTKKILKMLAQSAPGNQLRISLLRKCGYHVGADTYVGPGLVIADELDDVESEVRIGDRVAIGPRVTLVTASAPNNSRLKSIFGTVRGPVTVEDDAWIGAGAIILPGVTIGKMSVVGAGAVVTRDIPPNSVSMGVPAKVVKQLGGHDETES